MISVDDSGSGLSEERLKHIFERFMADPDNGTGLEMPICKELVEQMGGTIEVNSTVGKGTTVWITLPCEASSIERNMTI